MSARVRISLPSSFFLPDKRKEREKKREEALGTSLRTTGVDNQPLNTKKTHHDKTPLPGLPPTLSMDPRAPLFPFTVRGSRPAPWA